jgi:hypothetical protein
MMWVEKQTSRLSFFGRMADDLTRQVLLPADTAVFLENERRKALIKADGHFAFADLEPSPTNYRIHIGARSYQDRVISQALPTGAPVQVTSPGEDELYLLITGVATPQKRVTFEQITFVAPIEAGAAIIGEGGFTATLAEALEGQKVTFVVLSTVTGLAAGQMLRIVRSPNLLLRPGPYYPFAADVTVLAVKVVANASLQTALGDAAIEITRINGTAPTLTDVGGLQLSLFDLGGNPPGSVILDDSGKNTATNDRGDAVFYFPGSKPITTIDVTVSKTKYQTTSSSINVTANARTFQNITLTAL